MQCKTCDNIKKEIEELIENGLDNCSVCGYSLHEHERSDTRTYSGNVPCSNFKLFDLKNRLKELIKL